MKVVIGSGGARGVIALGAVDELQRQGFFKDATEFAGVSIGAVIAAGLVLGVSPRKMLRIAAASPMQADIRPANFGMDTGKGLTKLIRRMLGLRQRISLAELHAKTAKTLVICVCNLTDRATEHWTHETHPDVSLLKALRISCSIPLVFGCVKHGGKLYVDGAVADTLPIGSDAANTLAIGFRSADGPIETMEDFVQALRGVRTVVGVPRMHLRLDPGDVDALDFDLSPEKMREAFENGRDQASSWAKKNV